ncbi:Low complexity witha potential C2C2 zinc ribbon [Cryptosporidium xiaoi]|uniref:Low complexity witha potential C2C2 zinc ribbon n=1 Tax=Cryptosporidium xiaoi TaxID=659607 RepID=A0AAV9Y3I6_9CRYT
MKETISEIENISINSKNTDEFDKEKENAEENKRKNENLCSEITSDCNPQTPERLDSKNINNQCILCRDYTSPICTDCKRKSKVSTLRKSNENVRIVPNGKVKALAKQFECTLPEIKNDSFFFSYSKNVTTTEEFSNCFMNKVTHKGMGNTVNGGYLDSIDSENDQNSPSNISVSSTSSSLSKNRITSIKDPEVCGLINPIEAIINSSNNLSFVELRDCSMTEVTKEIRSKLESDVIASENTSFENINEAENNIILAFESLNHLEQRVLLISWITTSLDSKGENSINSETDKEIRKLLRELVEDLEYRNINEPNGHTQDIGIESHSEMDQISIPQEKKQTSTNPNLLKFKSSIPLTGYVKTRGYPNFLMSIGIPEDEEIEEKYIDEFISRTRFRNEAEAESLIIDESELSPKSEITFFDGFEDENSITKIGNSFFGFFK